MSWVAQSVCLRHVLMANASPLLIFIEETLPSISIAMPAYNEEANIEPQVQAVMQTFLPLTPDFEVIVVNDGSRDQTGSKVRALMARYPNVRLVEHSKNLGSGAAVYSSFIAATKEWVFLTDADRQFDVSEVRRFLPHIERADLILGYRAPRRDPFHRRLNGWGWSALTTLLFGYTARDVDCAFKLFKREILAHISIQVRGATFSAEFLVRAKRAGYTSVEVPVSHLPRRAGKQTGARLDVVARAFRELVQVRVALWRER
jgi:glycosyltransferase involved in cell wall biosynthesis